MPAQLHQCLWNLAVALAERGRTPEYLLCGTEYLTAFDEYEGWPRPTGTKSMQSTTNVRE